MKMLDEVIEKCQENVDLVARGWNEEDCFLSHEYMVDMLHYLKEYKKQKYIWKKLYQLFETMFWGLEEEYPLDGERIENLFFDAYNEGFDDADA